MQANNEIDKLNKIDDLYKNLSYFDQYGSSVLTLILVLFILFLICSYCYVIINIKPLQDNWPTERCKPFVLPFAVIINAPPGTSFHDYTVENFNYCVQGINSSIAGYSLEPLTYLTDTFIALFNDIKNAINNIRAMFDKIKTQFSGISKEIMGRIMNIMIPIQQIIISMRDFLAKIYGTMTAGIFTLFGAYMSLVSLFGAISEMIIMILIALAIVIMVLWIVPFTWGAAGAMTAIFLGISLPMVLILVFMVEFMHIKPNMGIPTVKCFDPNTFIKLNNSEFKKIKDIVVGDVLQYNNEVTDTIKVTSKNSVMYKINDIIVSDSHKIKFNGQWISVSNHPESELINPNYAEKYLYCLNTKNKNIIINNYEFSDWDEIFDLNHYLINQINHGLTGNNLVKLNCGKTKKIKDIKVGDLLTNNNIVYGIVETNGKKSDQYKHYINSSYIYGTDNLCFKSDNSYDLDKKLMSYVSPEPKIYHLLTKSGFFEINNIFIYDYNYLVDKHLSIN